MCHCVDVKFGRQLLGAGALHLTFGFWNLFRSLTLTAITFVCWVIFLVLTLLILY